MNILDPRVLPRLRAKHAALLAPSADSGSRLLAKARDLSD